MIVIPEKSRYGLSNIHLAELEIRYYFYKYTFMKVEDLKHTNVIEDIEEYFAKWCPHIPALRKIRGCMRKEIKSECYTGNDVYRAYKCYIEYVFTEMFTLNVIELDKKATRITNKILDGIQKHYDHVW